MLTSDFHVLSRIFDAETRDLLPAQLRSKHLPRLEQEGLVMPMRVQLPGRFAVVVDGWQLTERGRILYCEECSKRTPAENEAAKVEEPT